LELLAEAAARIGEDHHDALAVAADGLDRLVERQLVEVHREQSLLALLGEVAAAARVDDVAREDVRDLVVGVDDLVADHDLVEARVWRLGHAVDLDAAEARLDAAFDGGLVGTRRNGDAGEEKGGEQADDHGTSLELWVAPIARRASSDLTAGI